MAQKKNKKETKTTVNSQDKEILNEAILNIAEKLTDAVEEVKDITEENKKKEAEISEAINKNPKDATAKIEEELARLDNVEKDLEERVKKAESLFKQKINTHVFTNIWNNY